jgi:hypothetical protein
MRNIAERPEIVDVTVNVPVSVPSEILYAHPIAIDGSVADELSPPVNSVNPPPHDPNALPVELAWYKTMTAISRSPAALSSVVNDPNVCVVVAVAWVVGRSVFAPVVGIVGNATAYSSTTTGTRNPLTTSKCPAGRPA